MKYYWPVDINQFYLVRAGRVYYYTWKMASWVQVGAPSKHSNFGKHHYRVPNTLMILTGIEI